MRGGRAAAGAAALALALSALACTTPERDELVGRYGGDTREGRQTWTFGDDGTCRVDGEGQAPRACDWLYTERAGRRVVVVTFRPAPRTTESLRYVLTPGKWVVGGLSIPLPDGSVLRKVP